jgi:quercetin dioxygenase-like cupin family protein
VPSRPNSRLPSRPTPWTSPRSTPRLLPWSTPRSPRTLAGPTPLDLPELRQLTRRIAAEVRAGRHPVTVDLEHRWYRLLSSDGYVDVWLISWAGEQGAELHDHAGSLGALTVVRGTLTERYWAPAQRRLHARPLPAGVSVGFALGHVHDVRNDTAEEPAVSVHAYSPPLTAMSYYRIEPGGLPRRTRTELTRAPEADLPGSPEADPTGAPQLEPTRAQQEGTT